MKENEARIANLSPGIIGAAGHSQSPTSGRFSWLPVGRLTLLLGATLVLLLSSCNLASAIRGSGKLVTQPRDVSGFERVTVLGSGELTIRQGEVEALTVRADDNLLPSIRTEVRGNTLFLGLESGRGRNFLPTSPIRFNLTVNDLEEIEITGSGSASAQKLETGRLELTINGSGDIDIDSLTVGALEVQISGSGSIEVAGRADAQNVDLSGSGRYLAERLRSKSIDLGVSGSGDATVWATERLEAVLSGSGSIGYYGSPNTDVQSTGSGRIRSLGER